MFTDCVAVIWTTAAAAYVFVHVSGVALNIGPATLNAVPELCVTLAEKSVGRDVAIPISGDSLKAIDADDAISGQIKNVDALAWGHYEASSLIEIV